MVERSHQPCPHPDCHSSDAFSYNEEKMVGHCHSCDKPYPAKGVNYEEWVLKEYPLENKKEVKPVSEVLVPTFKSYRGITEKTAQKYNVQTYVDSEGNLVEREYIYPSGCSKVRRLPKQFYTRNSFKTDELFGMDLFAAGTSMSVTVTEGEEDAMSVWQMMGDYPVVSLPSATPSKTLWQGKAKEWLDSFERIVLAIDSDEAGDAICDRMAKLFPNKIYRVPLVKFKDANDYLTNGAVEEFKKAWWAAKKYTPENIWNTPEQFLTIFREENDSEFIPTGIQDLDDVILGLMQGHFTVFQAPEGIGKCLGPNQKVLRSDGSTVRAKNVRVGDKLMGVNSKPRTVLSVCEGEEEMFKITPTKGKPWTCNKSHILSLVESVTGEVVNISVGDYINKSKAWKQNHLQYRSEVSTFKQSSTTFLKYDPYIVGLYLGDGAKHNTCIYLGSTKKNVINYLKEWADKEGFKLTEEQQKGCIGFHITKPGQKSNPFTDFKRSQLYTCKGFKKIPNIYKTSGKKHRAKLLAGLLDTDGSVVSNSGAEITQKSKRLSKDILFVARSLGFAAYMKPKIVKGRVYYRISISGDLYTLPTLRLQFTKRKQKKNVLRTGIKVESIGVGKYNGFTLDGDKLFLLDDFTVTHNTEFMRFLEYNLISNHPDIPIAISHSEETKKRSLLGLVSYKLEENVTRKDLIQEKGLTDLVEEAITDITKRENVYQFAMGVDDDPNELLDKIRFFSQACGCKYIFFEPIQDLAYSQTSDDTIEGFLSKLSTKLARLAAELNVGIITIAHENDDGQIRDCRMIGKRASVVVKLSRDKMAEDEDTRNTTDLLVIKNRPAGTTGFAGHLKFNPDSFTLKGKYGGF